MYEELIKGLREPCPHENCVLCQRAADAIDKLDTLLDGLEADNDALCETIERLKKPRWIPVTERLPVDVGYYIVYCWDGHINRVSFAKWQKNNRLWYLSATRAYWKVSHWMPLPEPPKEENIG